MTPSKAGTTEVIEEKIREEVVMRVAVITLTNFFACFLPELLLGHFFRTR